MKSIICFLLVSMFSIPLQAFNISSFDSKLVYKEPLAYTRSPDNGVTVNIAKYNGEQIGYLEAALGHNIPAITLTLNDFFGDDLTFQLCMTAGFWATLGYDEGAFPLLTQDFLMAVPLGFRWGNISGALKFEHISAHLGDGFSGLLEDDLSAQEQRDLNNAEEVIGEATGDDDVGITLKEPFSYSRDFLSFHLSYDNKIGRIDSRVYHHIGYAHKMIPDYMGRLFVGGGFEAIYRASIFSPYYANDFTYNEDTDSVDWSGELGAIVLSDEKDYFILRIAATIFIGKDRRGQLYGNKLKQYGIGFFIY